MAKVRSTACVYVVRDGNREFVLATRTKKVADSVVTSLSRAKGTKKHGPFTSKLCCKGRACWP